VNGFVHIFRVDSMMNYDEEKPVCFLENQSFNVWYGTKIEEINESVG
jgi:hypothetical protein